MNTCAACTGCMHPMRPEDTASCPSLGDSVEKRQSSDARPQVPVPCRGCPVWSLSHEGFRTDFRGLSLRASCRLGLIKAWCEWRRSENFRSLAGTFEFMAPEDVCQMVALARCDHCVVKLLGGIGQCRFARHCQGLGGMARGQEHGCTVKLLGRACSCIRPSSCLVIGCTLVDGTLC